MRTCYETSVAGFPVKIEQDESGGRFAVTYGQPICDDCLTDWNKCFPDPLTTVNNLSIVVPVASLIHPERYTK